MDIFKRIKSWYHNKRNPEHCDLCQRPVKIQVVKGLLGNYCFEHGTLWSAFTYSGDVKYLVGGR